MRNEILDKILALLMTIEVPIFTEMIDRINRKKIDMDFMADAFPEYEWDDYMKESFKKELLYKKYIAEDENEDLSITELGREFKRKGGYEYSDKKINQEDSLREKQLENLNLDIRLKTFNKKYNQKFAVVGIIILILNFFITIITLDYFNKNDREEILLKEQNVVLPKNTIQNLKIYSLKSD